MNTNGQVRTLDRIGQKQILYMFEFFLELVSTELLCLKFNKIVKYKIVQSLILAIITV